MSEGDVSLIHDEDLLRRMWQQTEDFSRKKEIRAHMYRLREERLRNLYSPDPKHEGKGSEFMATQDHVKSFADQTFQSMKSKEVRDAGSPPKEFSYHGQDLKALSNAGWNVEQENKTTDDGHTHVKSVHANIEGRYDVDGGKGQFAAVDHHKEAVTEYHDDNSSLKRNETSSNTAAREHVVRTTDDGTQISSTTSSSTSTSKFQQMSSTTNEPVPYLTNDDYEHRKYDTSNENQSSVIRRHVTKANDFEQNVRSNDFKQESRKNDYDETIRRNDYETGELVARKVDYPDDNTRVVVETRCLPDGTRVTSTKREFRVPAQTTQSEHSYQTRSENKSYSTHQRSDSRDSSQIKRHVINKNDDRFTNIVDSQRNIDDYDFKRQTPENTLKNNDVETTVHKNVHTKSNDDYSKVQHYVTTNKTTDNVNQYRNDQAVHKKVINHSEFDKDSTVQRHDTKTTKRTVDDSKTNDDSNQSIQHKTTTQNITKSADNEDYIQNVRDTQYSYYDSNDQRENVTVRDNRTVQPKYYIDVQNITDNQPKESRPKDIETNNHQPIYPPRDTEERTYLARDSKIEEIVEKSNNTEQYHTTYQTDYSQKKVSNDWSPSHTAWASTLRADTPSTTRPSTRASSPGSKTYKSSTSSLRSSVSPDKTHRKPLSRGGSPSKIDRSSPVRTISDRHSTKYSATHSLAETKSMKNSSPERRVPTDWSPTRTTYSPERKLQEHPQRSSASPEKRPQDLPYKPRESPDRKTTPKIPIDSHTKKVSPHSPQERHYSPTETRESRTRSSVSPDKTSFIRDSTPNSNPCPDRKSSNQVHLDGYPGVVPDDARTVSPTRGSKMLNASPNPKSVHTKMTDKPSDKSHQSAPKRGSMSPNRKLDYRPTSPSQLSDNAKSPNKPLDMSSSTMHVEIPSTTHSLKDTITTTKFKQDHYKFIDEETKMYTRPDKTETDFRKSTSTRIASPTVSKQESSSPSRKSPSKDSNNITKEPERDSPSTTYNDTISDKYDSTIKNSTVFDDTDTLYEPTKFDDDKTNTERELSPSKFGTYEKKKPHTIKNSTTSTKTSTTTKDRSSTENLTLHKKSSTSPNEEFDDIKRTSTSSPYSPTLKCKSPSPSRMNSQKNFGDIPTLRERESPSRNSTVKTSDVADHITTTHLIRKEKEDTSPNDKISTSRETSPSKFGTYDKKKPHTKTTDVITTVIANESLSHPEKSQTKTAGKPESPTKKIPDLPISPNKKTIDQKRSPTRNKLQDASSPTKDLKHKVTTDFLITERTTEEINKTTTNQRPRQLQTPSSSPTRKLNKPIDNEPSTGQSSPTTSVSGFVYFSSPRNNDSVVTDLDDHENQNILIEQITDETMIAIERPQSLDVKRPPSPSKIPCRSPSPEKHIPHTNGSLPRKSSLKKPSGEVNQSPSIEKPPSSFYISPTEESKILPGHKTLKKDRPEESQMKTPTKTKPPLVRRETYEDRCRKILGMTDEISETSKQTSYFNEAEVNISSPMMARSPGLNFKKTPIESLNTTQVNTKVDTSDFISREQENNINTSRVNESCTKISQPLRDDLPRNLQNMVTKEKRVTDYDVSTNDHEESDFERRQSIDRKILYQHSDDLITKPEKPKTKLNETERPKSQVQKVNEYDESSSPAKLHPGSSPRTSMSPERKPANERKEKSSTKESTDKTLETTTTVSSKYDIINKTQEITVTTKSMPIKPSHIRPESPTKINSKQTATRPSHSNRQRESKQHEKIDHLNEKSLTKPICLESTISMVAQYGSTEELAESDTKSDKSKLIGIQTQKSPVRKSSKSLDEPANASDKNLVREPSYTGQRTESPVKKPQEERKGSSPTRSGYMKTTTSVTSKQESIDNYNSNITESTKRKTSQPKKSKSPTRMDIPQDSDKSPERKPGGRYPSPTKTNLDTKTDDKYFNFPSSESHDKPEKIPGYMKTTESVSSKYDNHTHESKTTTQYHIPRSQSPPHQHGKDDTSHYMQPIQPHQHIHETTATFEDEYETHEITHNSLTHKSPNKQIPHYMEPISSHIHKHETITSEDKDEIYTLSTIENKHTSSRDSPIRRSSKEQSPERRPSNQQPIQPTRTPTKKIKYDSNSEDSQENEEKISVGIQNKTHRPSENSPTRKVAELNNECPRIESSFKRPDSFNKKQSKQQDSPTKKPVSSSPSNRSESSPDRKSHYMKTDTSVILEQDTAELTEKEKTERTSSSKEPSRRSPAEFYETQAPKQLRTPSPTKQTTKVTEISTDFLMSEREQNILDRVQKSLRKLSPERKGKLPSPERSPVKTTTARVQDMDTITLSRNDDEVVTDVFTEFKQKDSIQTNVSEKPKTEKSKDLNVPRKLSSRNVSPAKKSSGNSGPTKLDKNLEPSTKHRSISPKKSNAPFERPQSPHSTKTSGIKPKEQIPSNLTRKPTPATLKLEKSVCDLKKVVSTTTKQNSITKTMGSKSTTKTIDKSGEPRVLISKGSKEIGISPRNDRGTETKVSRTVSDITITTKKISTSPQRVKSKPEIQINNMTPTKTSSKIQKSSLRENQSKLPGKPKSATTLNTPSDEDDIIIDVQQSKSSRENSPDRICPTPVNFVDDNVTPRYPDEVNEPDDDFRRHTHHTIHETESIVDDIVEICEDDELFVRKSNAEQITENDESLLSVTDKVSRFTNATTIKPKDTTSTFKDTERRVHSDFTEKTLNSDDCLLSVSEKVNKFAKGPRDAKEKSPVRKVFNEYDNESVYTDDYTKLSVHDKAHLFVETAENVKTSKVKQTPQKVQRPDLTNIDEALKSDDCLLSVSDKVHKFVKTAEQFLTETIEVEEKEKKIREQHEKIMKKIVDEVEDISHEIDSTMVSEVLEDNFIKTPDHCTDMTSFAKALNSKNKDSYNLNQEPKEKIPAVKITTLRSSEAVKKAKALFENIASTTPKSKEPTRPKTITKLTDIGVMKKSPKTDPTTILHPGIEDISPDITDIDHKANTTPQYQKDLVNDTLTKPQQPSEKPRASPSRRSAQSPDSHRPKSPTRNTTETTMINTLEKHSTISSSKTPQYSAENDKLQKVPGYLRPTKTSQIKEETKVFEETEVSSRRGSGKFGVELRRTSVERSTTSSERRRSVEHPCIEDIFDLDLLEQMLEKVVGYEQRRRIRAQIRIARKTSGADNVDSLSHTKKYTKQTTINQKAQSPERHQTRSPERTSKLTSHKTASLDRNSKTPQKTITEGSPLKEPVQPLIGHPKQSKINEKRHRPQSPEKSASKTSHQMKIPTQPVTPDKKTSNQSPSKTATKPKANRFNDYASAYMKKVGLNETDKLKFDETKKQTAQQHKTTNQTEHKIIDEYSTSKSFTERTSSKDTIEVIHVNGSKRSPSPEKRLSPERKQPQNPEKIYERSPSPIQTQPVHHTRSEPAKKETIIKTVYDIEKKIPQKKTQEDKPSWITNRNLKKITSETRTFSSKKLEEKPKYRAPSPSKAITKPIDVITSSYGPGPLDADGKPLFGIKALRNGASNFQVKGTVIRQEYHSRNGGEPEGSVSVTAYSTEPEELERLLQRQGAELPSRIHGLSAITTTKKFGGETGTTLKEIHGKEERAAIDQFTHSDRRVSDTRVEDITESFTSRQQTLGESKRIETRREEIVENITRDSIDNKTEKMQKRVDKLEKKAGRVDKKERPDDKKNVRQSSVKSLTEKYIKNTNESSKSEKVTYPKAGLILRTTAMKDSVSSDSSAHAGLARTDSEHSLGSVEDSVMTTERCDGYRTVTTTRTQGHQTHVQGGDKSFLDSNTKVTGVQDILTRMKNADIVIQDGDSTEDTEARALLNKFLGATVLMAGMQSYVTEKPTGKVVVKQETVRTTSSGGGKVSSTQSRSVHEFDIEQCWDERLLRKLLDECTDYEQRRRVRARIRTLMAEQEACASAVTEALAAAGETPEENNEAREEEEVTVTSSVRRDSSDKTVSSSTTTTKTTKVIESMTRTVPKPVSPFAKFRQLEKQNSTNSPNSPSPKSPGSPAPYFKFTEPALQASAVTIKERLLQWCRDKTRDYENVKLENFSTSWADGLAFCALIHHFLPDAFDYSKLSQETRRHNFTLAFKIADEKAGIYPLLDVDDMVAMRKPDWKCVFTYVQSIHRRFKDQD